MMKRVGNRVCVRPGCWKDFKAEKGSSQVFCSTRCARMAMMDAIQAIHPPMESQDTLFACEFDAPSPATLHAIPLLESYPLFGCSVLSQAMQLCRYLEPAAVPGEIL